MHSHLKQIFETQTVHDKNGNSYPLDSHISIQEGLFLQGVIRAIQPKTSLEVGMAYGISTLFICEEMQKIQGARHIVIDPAQERKADHGDEWHGIGLFNVAECGYEDMIEHVDRPSEYALPQMASKGLKIQFAFIDGWHTFDHTLLDFFYINRMLEVGGVVVFDDSHMPSVGKVVNYLRNYPAFESFELDIQDLMTMEGLRGSRIDNEVQGPKFSLLQPLRFIKNKIYGVLRKNVNSFLGIKYYEKTPNRFYAFRKIKEDERPWDWFENF